MSIIPIQLSYARPRPRRRTVRRVMMLVMLVAVAVISIKTWPTAIHRARTLYWQRQAMRFRLPATQIVLENGSQKRQVVADTSTDYVATTDPLFPGAPSTVYFARPWRELYPLIAASPRQPGAVVYLHERHTVGGKPRLVALDARYIGCSMTRVDALVFEPGSATSEPLRMSESTEVTPFSFGTGWRDLQVFAGQSDPADPSHFTIAYQINGVDGIMDGRLDSNDHITLTSRVHNPGVPENGTAVPAAANIPAHSTVVQELGPPVPATR